ncbi:MAG: Acetyl-CoA decarbonylase/synthase complex subunit alpha 2 [Methanonatronarchaeales archaeon]|nr:Acetyl-CoA decarbonylase/synthase complex subunit alpha 2 [Methanonatronarchaeales archaeon]
MESRNVRLDRLEKGGLQVEGLELTVGDIEREELWDEPAGPYHLPGIKDLRRWDHLLLGRYDSSYEPTRDVCDLCTFGPCDLTDGKKSACGLDISGQTARMNLLTTVMGAAAHLSHAREIVEHVIEKFGPDVEIDMGSKNDVEAPMVRVIAGTIPETVGDLLPVVEYCEEEMNHLTSATSTMQEGSPLEFDSKSLHAGMMDNLALEIADIAQISAFDMPRGDEDAPLAEIGMGTMDPEKPVVLAIGHNVAPGTSIIDYMVENGLEEEVEVGAVCCNAHDMTRINPHVNVVGALSKQVKYIRTGAPDVVVIDEQCIRADVLEECRKVGARLVACSGQAVHELQDVSDRDPGDIVEMMVDGEDGVFLPEIEKVGEVAIETARSVYEDRLGRKAIPEVDELQGIIDSCTECGRCDRACPEFLPITDAMVDGMEENGGDWSGLEELWDRCVGCTRCDEVCPVMDPMSVQETASEHRWKTERNVVRTGRGPINDTEIRNVGAPIVLGEIPGVVAFVGCDNYPDGGRSVAEVIRDLAERNYIVLTSGCSAMTAGDHTFEDGQTVYEMFDGRFDKGCVSNVGSCVANAHIVDAALKIANLFANVPLRDNFEEVSDYVLHRIGAVGVCWGVYHQKALAIANGAKRWGIPVVQGPHGVKFRRQELGRPDLDERWVVNDANRDYEEVQIEPAPEHLGYSAESIEEMAVMAVKLCMRPNDTRQGRMIKLTNYIDLYRKYFDEYPSDLARFVRHEKEVPLTEREEVMEVLEDRGWEPRETPNPTMLREEDRLI